MLGVIYLVLCMLIGKELAGLLLSKKGVTDKLWFEKYASVISLVGHIFSRRRRDSPASIFAVTFFCEAKG